MDKKMSMLTKKVESKYIKKAFLVKFGNVYIIPEIEEPEKVDFEVLMEKIKKCLNNSPLMKKIRKIDVPTKSFGGTMRMMYEATGFALEAVMLSHPLKAEINLPVKNQGEAALMSSLIGKRVDLTTKFGILYNASIYAMFREADLTKISHPGAPDIRDLLESVIKSEKSWRTTYTGPNPLRQDFFFVYLVDNKNTQEYIGKIFVEGSRLYLYQSEKWLKKFDQMLATILYTISSRLDIYYSGIFQHDKLEDCVQNLNEIHESIQSIIASSLKLSFFDIMGHYRNSKELEKLISKHYSGLLDYSSNLELLRKRTEEVEKYLSKNFLLGPFIETLMEELKHQKIDVETLTKCASYAREVIQKSYTTKVTLLGAAIGILGTIFGTLILHYLGV